LQQQQRAGISAAWSLPLIFNDDIAGNGGERYPSDGMNLEPNVTHWSALRSHSSSAQERCAGAWLTKAVSYYVAFIALLAALVGVQLAPHAYHDAFLRFAHNYGPRLREFGSRAPLPRSVGKEKSACSCGILLRPLRARRVGC